jgi:hypothetical protein
MHRGGGMHDTMQSVFLKPLEPRVGSGFLFSSCNFQTVWCWPQRDAKVKHHTLTYIAHIGGTVEKAINH